MNFKDVTSQEVNPGDFVVYAANGSSLRLCIALSVFRGKSKWGKGDIKLKMLSTWDSESGGRTIYNTPHQNSVIKILPEGLPYKTRCRLEEEADKWKRENGV